MLFCLLINKIAYKKEINIVLEKQKPASYIVWVFLFISSDDRVENWYRFVQNLILFIGLIGIE